MSPLGAGTQPGSVVDGIGGAKVYSFVSPWPAVLTPKQTGPPSRFICHGVRVCAKTLNESSADNASAISKASREKKLAKRFIKTSRDTGERLLPYDGLTAPVK